MGRKYRVLLGNDELLYRETMAKKLEEFGFDVRVVPHDGVAVLDEARMFRPDVIGADDKLPFMNIFEIIKYLRQKSLNIPKFIYISSYGNMMTPEERTASGITACLEKPFDMNVLYQVVLELHAHEFCEKIEETSLFATVRQHVLNVLIELNCPLNGDGFQVLQTALTYTTIDPENLNLVTKDLYRKIAKQNVQTYKAVEIAIRRKIEAIWKSGNAEALLKYFGTEIPVKPLSNVKFLSAVSSKLREELNHSDSALG